MSNPDLSIIILSYNTRELTSACIESLYKHTRAVDFEVLVVDNASEDGSQAELKQLAKRHKNMQLMLSDKNLGFVKGNNKAMKRARGKYILLLNSDTELKSPVLPQILEWMNSHPKSGIATCELKNPDGTSQGSGGAFPTIANVFAWMFFLDDLPILGKLINSYHPKVRQSGKAQKVDWITGAFFMIRKEVISKIGYLNEDFFMYVEDMEYCYRVRKAGWEVWYLPQVSIIHFGGASSIREYPIIMEMKNLLLFFKNYRPAWEYSIYRFLFKVGCILRIVVFRGPIYVKAFQQI